MSFNHPTTRPDAPGLYEVQAPIRSIRTETRFYAVWSGVAWCPAARTPERARDPVRLASVAVVQNKPWKPIAS